MRTPPRRIGTVLGAVCPVSLLGLYLFLASTRGTRLYDAFASRNMGTGLVAFAVLALVFGGVMVVGVLASTWAVWRREQPTWVARALLAVNAVMLLAALRAMR